MAKHQSHRRWWLSIFLFTSFQFATIYNINLTHCSCQAPICGLKGKQIRHLLHTSAFVILTIIVWKLFTWLFASIFFFFFSIIEVLVNKYVYMLQDIAILCYHKTGEAQGNYHQSQKKMFLFVFWVFLSLVFMNAPFLL